MSASQARPLRVCFVMEQVLGHVTWSQNLRRALTDLNLYFRTQRNSDSAPPTPSTSYDAVAPRHESYCWTETHLYKEGGIVERLPGLPGAVRASLRALLDVRRGTRGCACDVLVFNTQKPALFCQADMLRVPTILMTDVTPRQYDRMAAEYEHDAADAPVVRAAKHRLNVLNFRLARAVVGWSHWVARSLVDEYGVPPARVHVIPPGVDTNAWRPQEGAAAGGPVRLLFVGGNFERKGGALLLDVFRRLGLHRHAELHLVTRDDVGAAVAAPGVTVHRGLRNNSPELHALYRSAGVFVLPTLADCFSIASIEAMACGLPVITTDVGGIGDIVEHGATGFLVPPRDGAALASALAALLADAGRRRAFGAAARERAVQQFDARHSAGRLLALARTLSS
jgi:glycosyltransferase involved in cell wall biosynthesis